LPDSLSTRASLETSAKARLSLRYDADHRCRQTSAPDWAEQITPGYPELGISFQTPETGFENSILGEPTLFIAELQHRFVDSSTLLNQTAPIPNNCCYLQSLPFLLRS